MNQKTTKSKAMVRIARWCLTSPMFVLLAPYVVGIVWHGLHPIASVLTGDMQRARRWYIDENSLDPTHFQSFAKYDLILQTKYSSFRTNKVDNDDDKAYDDQTMITSLCHGIEVQQQQQQGGGIVVPCHRHITSASARTTTGYRGFEIAKIVPLSAGLAPVGEAIVLVVPSFVPFSAALRKKTTPDEPNAAETNATTASVAVVDKSRAQFQASILQLIRRMASPQTTPWLAKTIFVVSPILSLLINETDVSHVANLPSATSSMSPVLEATVESFLDAYIGRVPSPSQRCQHRPRQNERLPLDYMSGAIVRNLIVLDLELFAPDQRRLPDSEIEGYTYEPQMSELRILPQGRRGLLPNMDLPFVVKAIFDRSNMGALQQLTFMTKQKYTVVDTVVHPYHKRVKGWWEWLQQQQQRKTSVPKTGLPVWCRDLLNLLAFESVLAVGPYPPHAPALERGIDALTIQAVFCSATDADDFDQSTGNMPRTKLSPQQYPMELVEKMELVFRSLSNLHERLHHSTSLYLLTSKDRFVKHEEYLVPNLLLVIPLLVRAGLLVLFRNNNNNKEQQRPFRPDFVAAGQALAIAAAWAVAASALLLVVPRDDFIAAAVAAAKESGGGGVVDDDHRHGEDHPLLMVRIWRDYQMALVYLGFLSSLAIVQKRTSLRLSNLDARQSIQFAACLLAAGIHVSIAFGHVSLAYPSALFWTPLLAFPAFRGDIEDQKAATRSRIAFAREAMTFLVKVCFFVATCPFVFLVPHVFSTYTPYVRYVYIPLHMLVGILYIAPGVAI